MTTPKHPGGRPRIGGGDQVRRNINLSDDLADRARDLGNGNLSAGIRAAIVAATDQNPIDPAIIRATAELLQGARSCIIQATALMDSAAQPNPENPK